MNHIQSPRTDDATIEQEIQAKGLNSPRVKPYDIEANIVSEHYFTAAHGVLGYEREVLLQGKDADATNPDHWGAPDLEPLKLLTFCVLVLRNGFTVTGESACASPENFDAEVVRKVSRANAVQKMWPLLGYALKDKLYAPRLAMATAKAPT